MGAVFATAPRLPRRDGNGVLLETSEIIEMDYTTRKGVFAKRGENRRFHLIFGEFSEFRPVFGILG